MIKELKYFAAGVVTTSLLTTGVLFGFAEPIQKTVSIACNNIKIFIEGEQIEPKDVNGKKIEPFIYDGTTYLPVRAVSEALGKTVRWDGDTSSIYIGEKASIQEVTVSTAEEFVKALGSNKKILMKPGIYNLSKIVQKDMGSENVFWDEIFDGNELLLSRIKNLSIEGTGTEPSHIVVEPRYAYVFNIVNSENITIKNVKAGHTEEGQCRGGVFKFENSKNIVIDNSQLYGCGTEGVGLDKVEGFRFINSKIYNCSYDIMNINESNNVEFVKSSFTENKEYDLINIFDSKNVSFDDCNIEGNSTVYDSQNDYKYALFNVDSTSAVVVKNSKISKNKVVYLQAGKDSVKFENTQMNDNTFYKGEYEK